MRVSLLVLLLSSLLRNKGFCCFGMVAEPGFRECLLYDFSATARFKHVCTEIAAETAGRHECL